MRGGHFTFEIGDDNGKDVEAARSIVSQSEVVIMNRSAIPIVLLAIVGCATSGGEKWQHDDRSQPVDAEQLQHDKRDCLNRAGVPSPGGAAPLSSTRNQMIDCMRMKGWVER